MRRSILIGPAILLCAGFGPAQASEDNICETPLKALLPMGDKVCSVISFLDEGAPVGASSSPTNPAPPPLYDEQTVDQPDIDCPPHKRVIACELDAMRSRSLNRDIRGGRDQ